MKIEDYSKIDQMFFDSLSEDDQKDFRKWIEQLELFNAQLDFPYGDIAAKAGLDIWYEYYDGGYTAREAIEEDLSYGEDIEDA